MPVNTSLSVVVLNDHVHETTNVKEPAEHSTMSPWPAPLSTPRLQNNGRRRELVYKLPQVKRYFNRASLML